MDNKPLSVKEIAEYLRVSVDVIYDAIKMEKIPYYRVNDRKFLFFPNEIINWTLSESSNTLQNSSIQQTA